MLIKKSELTQFVRLALKRKMLLRSGINSSLTQNIGWFCNFMKNLEIIPCYH